MDTKVVGRRVIAFVVDGVLVSAVNLAIFFALAGDPVEGLSDGSLQPDSTVYGNLELGDTTYSVYGASAGLFLALAIGLPILYFAVFQGLRGYTLGKLMTGIRVVRDDGTSPPGVGRAFARWFLYIADAFPYVIPYLTGFVVALVSRQNKRIGDMVGGTLVVDKDTVGAAPAAAGEAGPTWVEGTRGPSGL